MCVWIFKYLTNASCGHLYVKILLFVGFNYTSLADANIRERDKKILHQPMIRNEVKKKDGLIALPPCCNCLNTEKRRQNTAFIMFSLMFYYISFELHCKTFLVFFFNLKCMINFKIFPRFVSSLWSRALINLSIFKKSRSFFSFYKCNCYDIMWRAGQVIV